MVVPVGWIAAGLALAFSDSPLDKRIRGTRPKLVGPIRIWWIFAWAPFMGAVTDFVAEWGDVSRLHTQANAVLIALFGALGIYAFRRRFGIR